MPNAHIYMWLVQSLITASIAIVHTLKYVATYVYDCIKLIQISGGFRGVLGGLKHPPSHAT